MLLAFESQAANSTDTGLWPDLYASRYNVLGADTADIEQSYGLSDQVVFEDPLGEASILKAKLTSPRKFVVRVSASAGDRSDGQGCIFVGNEKPSYRPQGKSWSIPAYLNHAQAVRSQYKARTHSRKMVAEHKVLWPGLPARLAELGRDALDDGIQPMMDSWKDFLKFALRNRISARPSLSVVDSGAIRAVWKNGDKEQVGLHFKGGDVINYVLFHIYQGEMQREFAQAGSSAVADLIQQKQLGRLLVNEG